MNISLNRNIFKSENNIITEIWSISPQKEILLDLNREVLSFIKLLILNEIPKEWNLISFEEIGYIIKSKYIQESQTQSKLISNITFRYIPFIGKKTCNKCIYYLKKNRKHYCLGRTIKLKKDYWHNCLYWTEKTIIKDLNKC
jgi:hypothetical protein